MNRLTKLSCVAAVLAAFSLPPTALAGHTKDPQKADQTTTNPVDDKTLKNAASKGLPLEATINVADQASVEAVLIPASLARRIFGGEVANNYAVIELIVSNRDSKAGLIVQSVFLDYSKWLLSGIPSTPSTWNPLTPNQKPNQPWQVASVESQSHSRRITRRATMDSPQLDHSRSHRRG